MKFFEGVNKTNDAIEEVATLISTKKEFLFKEVINVFLVFIILLVFGCLDFATLTMHLEYLGSSSYWGTVITKTVASVCSFNIGINLLLDTEIKKNEVLIENKRRYNALNEVKYSDFDYFIEKIYNPRIKRLVYIASINMKIYRLNKRAKMHDLTLYSSDKPEDQPEKARNKYCIARAELEELKSDAYINKNINSLVVKYKNIDSTIFELEIDGSEKVHQQQVQGSINKGRALASINVLLGVVLVSMFISSFSLTANADKFENQMVAFWHYCLKAVTDIGVVLWQLSRGILKTRSIVSQQLTVPYANRVKILMEYYAWRQANDQEVPKCYLDLFKEKTDEYEVIEMTEEELSNLKEGDK